MNPLEKAVNFVKVYRYFNDMNPYGIRDMSAT